MSSTRFPSFFCCFTCHRQQISSVASNNGNDPVDVPSDVITLLLGGMSLEDRYNCALVCSDWAKAAAAATARSIVRHGMRDLTQLQWWLEKYGGQVEKLQLHTCGRALLAGLPCAQLQDLLLHGLQRGNYALGFDSRMWSDIAAATKLTSVCLEGVRTISPQADVVSALTALPDLQQLVLEVVEFELSDSRLLQQLTKLTSLGLGRVAAEALQHLSLLTKLQHLSMHSPPTWAAADYPGLQELRGLTSLSLAGPQHLGQVAIMNSAVPRFPACVSRFTALQQLELITASGTELDTLTALTALTKLGVTQVNPSATPLQLPALQCLELRGGWGHTVLDELMGFGPEMHASYLASCTQLLRLSLHSFRFSGPGSLVASSMLQELQLQDCHFSGLSEWELVYPGPGRLPHLTSLVLLQCAQHPQADFERVVACCSGLQVLQLGVELYTPQEFLGVSALAPLPHLTRLYLNKGSDDSCNSLAHLTGLRVLHVRHPWDVSVAGLRHLARLEQLTALGFGGEFQTHKVGRMVQEQLSDRDDTMPPCDYALVNKAPAGSPPDVSARLLCACHLAAGG